MNDKEKVFVMFLFIIGLFIGGAIGTYAHFFNIPSCKIWESPRLDDRILIADDVVCVPMNELNTTYYRYDTLAYNGTEYLVQKTKVGNTTAKSVIVCCGGKE